MFRFTLRELARPAVPRDELIGRRHEATVGLIPGHSAIINGGIYSSVDP